MDKFEIAKAAQDAEVQKRRVYKGMTLTRYGRISALTQAGTACEIRDSSNPGFCSIGMNSMNARYSDRTVKENIVQVGVHPLGFGLYLFDYKPTFRGQCGQGRQFGVIAQEVETVVPRAVTVNSDGYRSVNYGLLGIRLADQ